MAAAAAFPNDAWLDAAAAATPSSLLRWALAPGDASAEADALCEHAASLDDALAPLVAHDHEVLDAADALSVAADGGGEAARGVGGGAADAAGETAAALGQRDSIAGGGGGSIKIYAKGSGKKVRARRTRARRGSPRVSARLTLITTLILTLIARPQPPASAVMTASVSEEPECPVRAGGGGGVRWWGVLGGMGGGGVLARSRWPRG